MIDKQIFNALKDKLNIKTPTVYALIDKRRKSRGFMISREDAAALIASENGIDVSRFLSQEALSELRNLQVQSPPIIKEVVHKSGTTAHKVIDLGSGLRIQDALLPAKITQEAVEMARIYPVIYTFENSVRNVISLVLSQKYGENWWDTKVSPTIQRDVTDRIKKEDANRWHSKRGSAPIFYTNIGHLLSIIQNNWSDFKDFFTSQNWIETRIKEIEMSRNIVAHNNPISGRDIQRLSIYFQDWEEQIKIIKERI